MKDIFVSYTAADKGWAEWIAWELEKAGYTVVIQDWDFRPGENFAHKMREASKNTHRTLAVLSPRYLKSLYAQAEWNAAFANDPSGSARGLVPVMIEDVKLEGLDASIINIDLVGLSALDARERLLTGISNEERVKPRNPPVFPGQSPTTHSPPFPGASNFVSSLDDVTTNKATHSIGWRPKRTDIRAFHDHYFNYTLTLLRTAQDELWKNAVQDLCRMMEQGFRLSSAQRETLSEALDPLWTSSSYKTRNWIVKAVGLCRLMSFQGRLEDLFLDEATDEESKSWVLAAYSQLLDVSDAIALLNKCSTIAPSFELALQFYSEQDMGRIRGRAILKSMEQNETTAKWVTFFYGYNHPASTVLSTHPPISLVSALTSHHNNSVAEHALWALHRAPAGRVENSEVSLETLHARAPNVRRRSYLLIGKHGDSYDNHMEFLQSRLAVELDTYAREGLAQTIAPTTRFHPAMEDVIVEWFATESIDIVRLALLPHLVTFSPSTSSYQSALRSLINDSQDTLLQSRYRALAEQLPTGHFANGLLTESNRAFAPEST